MQVIQNFTRLLSIQTLVVISLSFIAIYACLRYDIAIELPTALIGIAIVFPIVFSINAAYRRREEALRYFASLKAHAVALFYAHGDWVEQDREIHATRMKELVVELLKTIRQCFAANVESALISKQIYNIFARFSGSMETLRKAGVAGSEVSRANQYLRSMMIEFERMRNILTYRTPNSLRAYSQVFLNTFPVLYAPYFADLSIKHFTSLGFLLAAFYSLVLVSLDNIQERLENPFDEVGIDDVNLNVAEEYQQVMALGPNS